MNIEDFKALLDTYGAKIDRWPEQDRTEANELLENSEDARTYYAQMQKVDALFVANDKGKPPAGFVDRIMKKTDDDR